MAKSDRTFDARPSGSFTNIIAPRIVAETLVVLAIVGWWLVARNMPDFIMPGPWAVAKRIGEIFTDPAYLLHVVTSTIRLVFAIIISVLLGSILALLPMWFPVTDIIVHERIKPFLNSFPSIGWAILAIIWFGPSHMTVVFIMVMILTPFCLVNVSEGIKELDQELIEMARSFTRRGGRILFKITLPLLTPYFVSALRIAYGVGWKIALVAELFGTESGLGYLLQQAQTIADAKTVFATCLAIVILFMLGEKLVIDPLARRYNISATGDHD